MDTAFNDQLRSRNQLFISQFLCDDSKASALNVSRFYIFKFDFHEISPFGLLNIPNQMLNDFCTKSVNNFKVSVLI